MSNGSEAVWMEDVERSTVWLAVVFGAVSVPWTYGFVSGGLPLWPAFVGSATYFAAGAETGDLARATESNLSGVLYAAATLWLADLLGGGLLLLSLLVGLAMFLASMHESLPRAGYVPGLFFGYASMFSVDAAGVVLTGTSGLSGATAATAVSIAAGAGIGYLADSLADVASSR